MEEKKEAPFQPGEKGFAVFLLIVGAYFFYESMKLYQASPGASSYGAVPLFVSALIIIFSIAIIISDWKKDSVNHGLTKGEAIKQTLQDMFPMDVLVIMAFILLYCAGLYLDLGFVVVTPVFLWGSMTYLMRKGLIKNLLWTALCMAFILLVFSLLFSVVLP